MIRFEITLSIAFTLHDMSLRLKWREFLVTRHVKIEIEVKYLTGIQ